MSTAENTQADKNKGFKTFYKIFTSLAIAYSFGIVIYLVQLYLDYLNSQSQTTATNNMTLKSIVFCCIFMGGGVVYDLAKKVLYFEHEEVDNINTLWLIVVLCLVSGAGIFTLALYFQSIGSAHTSFWVGLIGIGITITGLVNLYKLFKSLK